MVPDKEMDALALTARRDDDLAAVRRVLHRVAQEIGEDLGELVAVAEERCDVGIEP